MARISGGENGPSESIEIDTVNAFCSARSIAKIDYMKIDSEGHETSVLRGAQGMLGKGAIGVIKAEVALDPDSQYHTSIEIDERLPARVRLSAARLLRSVRRCS